MLSDFVRPQLTGISAGRGIAVILAGAVGAAAFPPVGAFPLILLSISLFIFLIRERNPSEARNLGLLYGLAYGGGTMYWLTNIFGIVAVSLIALLAFYFGALANLFAVTRGFSKMYRAATCAMIAVGIEWFRGEGPFLPFPWYTPVHALASAPDWIALARWFGTYGFSLLVWFIAGLGAFAYRPAWLLFALLPLASYAMPAFPGPDQRALIIQAEQFGAIERVISGMNETRVDLGVLPELAFPAEPQHAVQLEHGPSRVASLTGAPVVFGACMGLMETGGYRNVAVLIDSSSNIQGIFPKQRPVPLFMDGPPGETCPVFPIDEGILGIAICYDFDGPLTTSRLVSQGATVLVMPAMDKMYWSEIQHVHHELLQRLRAVESGRWLIRSASSGRSEVINPHGVPSEHGIGFAEDGMIVLPFGHIKARAPGSSLYNLGPFAAIFTVLFVFIKLWQFLRRR